MTDLPEQLEALADNQLIGIPYETCRAAAKEIRELRERFVSFAEYIDVDHVGRTVYIVPSEVEYVRGWKYHSFREAIAEIGLRSGQKIRVWQDVECVRKRLATKTSNEN